MMPKINLEFVPAQVGAKLSVNNLHNKWAGINGFTFLFGDNNKTESGYISCDFWFCLFEVVSSQHCRI